MSYSNVKIVSLFLIIILSFFSTNSCSDDIGNNNVVASINGFKLTKKEFLAECAKEMEYKNDYKTTEKGKKELLDCIIRKELLIQEAKRLGLDKNEKFIAAIEKYWEATLIKLLMEQKNQEIEATTIVSEKEIARKYNEYKEKDRTLPDLDVIENEIAQGILQEKKSDRIEDWIQSLHKKAEIKVNQTVFSE